MSLPDAVSRLAFAGDAFEPGHVWLAGAGPGSLGCLTLAVVDALARADAVVYDALVDPQVLQAAPQASLHYVGKRGGKPSVPQGERGRGPPLAEQARQVRARDAELGGDVGDGETGVDRAV